ncbi:tyrosine-type recombinase/integrase, partial [Actinomadura luteofluorescens]|uniref:tyrosine-type recombinase/integrase n=1 Tax=Actinomadura luteofluorescens TaxID=46163 RepID=UPI003D8E210A
MKGSTYKRCKCRGDDGKELGADCPKLRRKGGSWNPRHGVWYFRLELDPGPGGKRRTLRRGGFATEAAASEALDEAKAKEARGGNAQQKILVSEFLDDWIARRRGLRKSTHGRYSRHIATYLKPHLGHIELDKLRVRHLDDMFAAIEADNDRITTERERRRALRQQVWEARQARDSAARDRALAEIAELPPPRRPVGASTRAQIRATLRAALSDAARQELVTVNVAKLIRMGSGRRPKPVVWSPDRVRVWSDTYTEALEAAGEPADSQSTRAFKLWRSLPRPSRVMVWTPEQTGAFLDAAAGYRLYALYHLMTFAGLRRGETCGLEWTDVDLDARELSLYLQIVHITYAEVEESDLKTEGSKDTIPIDTATAQVLRTWRAQQREERLAWGEAWVQSGKVFTRENGAPLHPDHVSAEFQAITFTAGLPPIRLHDLRHGTATLMLAGGADMKLVQAQLRHSSIALTADTYTSVLPDVAREAVEGGAALVPRAAAAGSASTAGLPSGSPPTQGGDVTPLNRANQQVKASRMPRPPAPKDRAPGLSST